VAQIGATDEEAAMNPIISSYLADDHRESMHRQAIADSRARLAQPRRAHRQPSATEITTARPRFALVRGWLARGYL
jgi:hypothetical protein